MNQRITFIDKPELVELEPIAPLAPEQEVPPRRFGGFRLLLVFVVLLPMLCACTYYGFFAADQYVSETRFIVRSPQRQAAGLLSSFLQSTGFVRAQDDSYAVSEFIRSRAAVAELNRDGALIEVFSRRDADFLTRYPQFWITPSEESLFRHYLKYVTVTTDSASGVTTMQVKAFRPDDAQWLALALVKNAEDLINRLNDRARNDAVHHAAREVADSEARLADAHARITEFRNREALVDPDKQSTSILDLIAKLALDVAEKKARLFEIERQTPQSPQIPALRANIAATEEQISRERDKVVGKDSSIAPRIAAYEQLLLERELATRMLASATTSLENARLDAQRQQLYLERIVEPHLPDHATHPKALYALLLLLSLLLAILGIIRILVNHLYEHVET